MASSRLAAAVRGRAATLRAELADADRVQVGQLRRLVLDNADTAYGRAHGFGALAAFAERACNGSAADDDRLVAHWQARVPIVSPDELAPWIARSAAGEADVLFRGRAIALEQTGGSTGGARLVAYSAQSLVEFQHAALPWLDDRFAADPSLATRPAYWAISPVGRQAAPPRATGGVVDPGAAIALGIDDAAYLGEPAGAGLIASLAVPPAIGAIGPIDSATRWREWQRLTLVHLLACRSLGLISVWSPSFLGLLLQAMDAECEGLIDAIRHGPRALDVDHARVPAEAIRWRASPARADELLACLVTGPVEAGPSDRGDDPGGGSPRFDPTRVWPDLRLVSCWADAGAAAGAAALARRLPHAHHQPKGLLATEGAITLPLSPWPDPVLAIRSGFFEFVDDAGAALPGSRLRAGDRYAVVLSNASGLYRYRLGDVVECTGHAGRAPMLRFVGRGDRVVDLVGEKLDDAFVQRCIADLRATDWPGGRRPDAAMLAAVDAPGGAGYRLLIEAPPGASVSGDRAATDASPTPDGPGAGHLADALDAALSRNPQYAYARRLGQLARPQVLAVPGLTRRWIAQRVAAGQSLGDVKLPSLLAARDGERLVHPPPAGAGGAR
ncbi:MAG: GH3 auxin-responsive promoter family protein [Lautropia sp.]